MSDGFTDPWEAPPEPDPTHDAWLEHREHVEQEHRDRLERFSDSFVACVVCHSRPAHGIYGVRCQGCFEAQRAEREAA